MPIRLILLIVFGQFSPLTSGEWEEVRSNQSCHPLILLRVLRSVVRLILIRTFFSKDAVAYVNINLRFFMADIS
jgi:hypothetical protein